MINSPKIIIVGDTFPTYTNVNYFSDGDVKSLFGEKICEMFNDADLTICNLEGALTDNPGRCNKIGAVVVAPTSCIIAYKKLGVDCCMLANNHITDGGHQGVIDTIDTLDKAGISHIGAGRNEKEINRSVVYELGNVKVGLYNVCELMFNKPGTDKGGAWLYDEYIVCREIEDLKSKCDYLIVIYHGGIERFRYPSPEIKKRFHRMVDNGADMILSQHTHCVGCEEWYNGAYLLYGQGNFLFRDIRPGQTDEAIMIEVSFINKKADVKKHLVKSVDKKFIRYNEQQDFSTFQQRSQKVKDDNFVRQQFNLFCYHDLSRYMGAFRNQTIIMRAIRKFFPSIHKSYIFKSYSLKNLMTLFMYIRSEQKREEVLSGMEVLLDDVLNNRVDVNWRDR